MNKIKVATHNGRFHADDVCAVAILDILHDGNIEVSRTRDAATMEAADYVVDVGGKNDGVKYFDHHQEGGGGLRDNTIPYASFGLVWKKIGLELSGSKEVAQKFDKLFIQPIDAMDNGVSFVQSTVADLLPFGLNSVVYSNNPTWKEDESTRDAKFLECVEMFKKMISRELTFLKDEFEARDRIMKCYNESVDKRIVILDSNYPFHDVLGDLPEPIYAIHKSPQNDSWHVGGVWEKGKAFAVRKPFPASWAGKIDAELQQTTGVSDAVFCHLKRFLVTAKTKEGALELARKALEE